MRFITRELVEGDTSDQEWETTWQRYQEHLGKIEALLPEPLRELAKIRAEPGGESLNLHDALIRRVEADFRVGQLRLLLRIGDLQDGYADLDLCYDGVDFASVDLQTLEALANDPEAMVLCNEVDVIEAGGFTHRLLFWPKNEIFIKFQAIQWKRANSPDRRFARPEQAFVRV